MRGNPMNPDRLIEQARMLLQDSQFALALTGAGISTPSGIPDYRSPRAGLWNDVDMLDVASISAFRRRPEGFYEWLRPLASLILQAEPNQAHRALQGLEAHGPLAAVVTQNIDMLHEQAGSKTLLEVHGNLREVVCPACQHAEPAGPCLEGLVQDGTLPICGRCHTVMKPNVVLFGELLPVDMLARAEQLACECDVMLVAGTSLEVAPIGDLPALAHEFGARLIIVNRTPTHADHLADVVIHDDVATVLPQLAAPFIETEGESDLLAGNSAMDRIPPGDVR